MSDDEQLGTLGSTTLQCLSAVQFAYPVGWRGREGGEGEGGGREGEGGKEREGEGGKEREGEG